MVVLTAAVGEEILIDGRIRIKILAINGDEAHLEVNLSEFVRSDHNGAHEQQGETSQWPTDSA